MSIISSLLFFDFISFLGSDRSRIAHAEIYCCSVFHYGIKYLPVEIMAVRMAA